MRRYSKIIIDDQGNFLPDALVLVEDDKVPVVVQISALQNKLVSIGSKKVAYQRNIADLSAQETDIVSQIEEMEIILNSVRPI